MGKKLLRMSLKKQMLRVGRRLVNISVKKKKEERKKMRGRRISIFMKYARCSIRTIEEIIIEKW